MTTTAEKMTEAEVIFLARQAVANAGSQRAWADDLGVSAVFVCNVLRGCKPPSTAMCAALGIEKRTLVEYRAIELAEREESQ